MPAPTQTEPAQPTVQISPARQAIATWMQGLDSAAASTAPETAADSPEAATAVTPSPAPPSPAATVAAPQPQPSAPAPAAPPEPPEEKWPRTAAEWKARKESQKKLLDETVKRYEAKITELETKHKSEPPGPSPELESLKKEKEELSRRLQIVDVTQHPQFQAYFEGKTKAQIELAKRVVGNDLASKVESLLKQPDSEWRTNALEEIFVDLTPSQQSRLGGVLNSLAGIEAERQDEISRAGENYKQMLDQRANETKAQQAKLSQIIEDTVKAQMDPEKGLAPFQKRENDSTWNTQVDERVAKAKAILSGQGVGLDKVVQAAFHAVALGPVLEENLALRGELEKLRTQVSALSAATPRVEPAAQQEPGDQPKPVQIKQGMRPMDATKNWAKAMTEAMQGST